MMEKVTTLKLKVKLEKEKSTSSVGYWNERWWKYKKIKGKFWEESQIEINTQLTIESPNIPQSKFLYQKSLNENISENDIPERIQIAWEGRIQPTEDKIKEEIAYIMDHLKIKPKFRYEQITKALSESINSVLVEYRIKHDDVPFIYHFKPYITKELV